MLTDVSLTVGDQVVALIGANGAGKSTLVHILSGIHHPQKGRILWNERDITNYPPHRIVPLGIAQVPEGRHLFPNQSVMVNLRLGTYARRTSREVERERLAGVFELFPRLYQRRSQLAGTLSGGEQQMLSIGRALMVRPDLLILDEPSMGLAPTLVEDIFAALTELRQQGIKILLVEQNAKLALELADYGYVLETGRVVMSDSTKALASDERVRRAYLGSEIVTAG